MSFGTRPNETARISAGEDPLGFAAGDANVGRYVGNSLNDFSDPSGLQEGFPFKNYPPPYSPTPATWTDPKPKKTPIPRSDKFIIGGGEWHGIPVRKYPKWLLPVTEREKTLINWGCGGAIAVIANYDCIGVHLKKGARSFLIEEEALTAVADMQKRGTAILVRIQIDAPSPLRESPRADKPPFITFPRPGTDDPPGTSEIDPERINWDGPDVKHRNFAVYLPTPDGPTWVSASHGANNRGVGDPMVIINDPEPPEYPHNVFIAVPDSRFNSPLILPHE